MKVGIQNKEGRLILVWNDGKRRTMAIGLPDAPPAIAMLKARKASQQPQPNDLVFSTPNRLPINDRNFRRRAWTAVLKATGVTYRKPYTCRSTAASHALDNREDYVAVAKALGHPPRVLHDNYAEVIESRSVINTLELIQNWGICGRNPNAVFLALVKAQCEVDLALSCLMRSGGNSETHYRRILTIRSKHPGAGKSFTEYSQRDLESVAKAFEENERRKDYLEAERLLWKRQDPRVEAIADSQAHKLDTYLLYLLLESPDPEVQAKAKAWQESIHKGMDLAMQRIRARRNSTS
jgi:hypothetical protein